MFMMVSTVYANDIYITQSGATLDLDITQDGQNNPIGSYTTSSSIIGATTNFDIRQVGTQMLSPLMLMVLTIQVLGQ